MAQRKLVYCLSISSLIAVFRVVVCFETTHNIWNMVTICHTRQLPDNSYQSTVAVSPIECVVTSLTYNRSVATYDGILRQCFLHDINSQAEMGVIYVQSPMEDITRCEDLGSTCSSGVYRITPVPKYSFNVYCDMDSEGSPWTVIQNRQSREVDFYRNWDEYKRGFGDLLGNFWLGNEHVFALTKTPCVFRVQLKSWNGTVGYAEYSTFQVFSEVTGYELSISGFSGNISDAFRRNDGMLFTTPDRDNDLYTTKNCAEGRKGSWWHRKCTDANLNGWYGNNERFPRHAMYWKDFYRQKQYIPMKTSKMLLKKPRSDDTLHVCTCL